MYIQGDTVQVGNLACVVILAWENNLLISPLCSEVQTVINAHGVKRLIYNSPLRGQR